MSQDELWMRYFALGGMSQPLELEAVVHGALSIGAADRDVVVLALNERFRELGRDCFIPYSDGSPGSPMDSAGDLSTPASAQGRHGYRDALTGVLLRDAGEDQLRQAVDQAHRTDQPLTVVFLDVDNLKGTNDTQGHAAGDRLLQALGGALRRSVRSYDVVVRYGGDEFVCALPRAGLMQATGRLESVAKRLAAAVSGATVSAGFAALRTTESLDEVVRRADQDMYANRGRQRSGPG
ncbi:MAG TPA: GGDEF domain-containing protein [Mycobacteriales bacterium]|nr:GGDEF domain-containing protein [Mycobacteriales bacterium]